MLARLPAAAPELEFVFYSGRPGTGVGIDLTVLPMARLWSQARFPLRLWRTRPALFFAPAHVVPVLAPGRGTTVIHDLAFERFPNAYSLRDRSYLRWTTRWAVARCRLLLTVSQATANDLAELYGVAPDRVVVAHPGIGAITPLEADEVDRRLARLGLRRPFALQVGRVEMRKNQVAALRAIEAGPDLSYVAAGGVADRAMADLIAASPRAHLLGHTSERDLEAIWAAAEVALVPSLYEGFGLPLLEAMARGVPVVAAANSSLTEVGGEAALYVDETADATAFAAVIARARGQRRQLVERGLARAHRFDWGSTANIVAGVLRRLIERP